MEVIKVTRKNLRKYYNRVDGNIWYREKAGCYDFQICEDLPIEKLDDLIGWGWEMIFISVNWGRRDTV